MIKFGIVIPTYNREKLLKRAIESVFNQTYSNFVICVVEDCSLMRHIK
jgi:glycosyltransferase involved in cell wall biosynthesis